MVCEAEVLILYSYSIWGVIYPLDMKRNCMRMIPNVEASGGPQGYASYAHLTKFLAQFVDHDLNTFAIRQVLQNAMVRHIKRYIIE